MEPDSRPATENVTTLDYLLFIMKWKRLIIGITITAFMGIVIISFLLPKIYQAETRVLLPQQSGQSVSLQMLNQLGMSALPSVAGSAVRTTGDLYAALLRSRAVLDRVIERFDLMTVYKVEYREDARRRLVKALSVQDLKKSGTLTVAVEDRNPVRAAEMANAFVEELKNLSHDLAMTEASQRRLFFEEQLLKTKKSLVSAEESLKGYQEQTGAIEIKEQTRAVIEAIAQLRAQVATKEVERKVLKASATPQNPDLQKVEEQIQGMREQLHRLEARGGSGPDALMSTGRMPQAGTGYVRKMRELKYSETLYEMLAKQYEMAKMDEAKEAMVIQVVDKAIPPEKSIRPRKTFMIASYTLTGFMVALLVSIILEYRESILRDQTKRERIERLSACSRIGWKTRERTL